MIPTNIEFNNPNNQSGNNNELKRVIFRIIPFWPLAVLIISLFMFCAYLYLRYAIPVYEANARLIVNDDSQQKSANILEAFKIDTRNISNETERELEVLRSKDLLRKLVVMLQLNVQYSQKGFVRDGQFNHKLPVELTLENPDSIKAPLFGEVKIVNGQVNYLGETFPTDTLVRTRFGNVRWHINKQNSIEPQKRFSFLCCPYQAPLPESEAIYLLNLSVNNLPYWNLYTLMRFPAEVYRYWKT